MKYDVAGNVISSEDGNGNLTQYGYNKDPNNLNIYARVTSVTNAGGQRTVNYYGRGTGKLLYSTDVNGVTAGYEYNDSLDRLTHVERAGIHTNYSYNGRTR
jgi:hypothetical protein